MSNVVYLNVPGPQGRRAAAMQALTRSFATQRRSTEDVFWLKENAELLNILECTGQDVPETALAPYRDFYDHAHEKLAFFPQYYRFILSLTLDLEALGMAGETGESLCAWAAAQDLAGGETSDIQRLEAQRLMKRRGIDPLKGADTAQSGAEARLRDFISRPNRFALPNKKAAFELTHIVFYLSEYGRKDPQLGKFALQSLENAGILAFLDGNLDLLAEICVAMCYAKHNPPAIWVNWVAQKAKDIEVQDDPHGGAKPMPINDHYHEFLTIAWHAGAQGAPMFSAVSDMRKVQGGPLRFYRPGGTQKALREMSVQLYRMGTERGADWTIMRDRIGGAMSSEAQARLELAEASTGRFETFFEDFARATPHMGQMGQGVQIKRCGA